jgi:hypothetical protein
MLKLRNIRARHIHQRRIRIHYASRDERLHSEMVVFNSGQSLQVAPRKHQRTKVVVDGPEEGFCGRMMEAGCADVGISAVAIDAHVVSEDGSAGGAERFDGEDVAFLHALGSFCLDERDLLVAVDLVAKDVVAGDVADGFDGDGFVVEDDFVGFHDFLDCGADFGDAGIDAGFLRERVRVAFECLEMKLCLL